jgi:hypothetical protein
MDETSLPAPLEPARDYSDRSTGLIIFGILTLLLGCLTGLMVPLMIFGQIMAPKTTQVQTNFAAILPAIFMYSFLAVALVWLGIGSIMARRWARALLLIFSWSWLGMGVIMLIGSAFVMPNVMANLPSNAGTNHPMPPGAIGAVMVVMFLFLGFFFILLPIVWVWFYQSRQVKANCEARNPEKGWTDTCLLPVLGLFLWLIFSVPMMLLMPFTSNGVAPFFGFFLSGIRGTLYYLALAALWSYAAWLIYQLKPQGWWFITIGILLFAVSGLLTFSRHDMMEMYQLMGYPQAQVDQIKKMGLFSGNNMAAMMAVCVLPFFIYLLFVKKIFLPQTHDRLIHCAEISTVDQRGKSCSRR